jgi:hydroxysqualene dehydroxylase
VNWDVIVIGAGCAGLACATKLAEGGKRVLVLERRPLLGGRASSFRDEASSETVDNGQHLFLGCYTETQAYLKRIGSIDKLKFKSNFEALMCGPDGERARLRSAPLPPPWNLAVGLLRYSALPLRDRIKAYRVARAASNGRGKLSEQSVTQWLTSLGQSQLSRDRFWDLLTLATLNINPDQAPADLLAVVLKEGFLASAKASRVGLASVGLSELHANPSKRYIEARGGEVRLRTAVKELVVKDRVALGVKLADGMEETALSIVCAVPPSALAKLAHDSPDLRTHLASIQRLAPSPILSLHIWLDRDVSIEAMVGFWGQEFHWVFSKKEIYGDLKTKHLSVVASSARKLLDLSKEELIALCERELQLVLPAGTKIARAVVLRESEATWVPPLGDSSGRLGAETPVKGLYLAGDWTATGLPATIEGAVKSGHTAAERIAV